MGVVGAGQLAQGFGLDDYTAKTNEIGPVGRRQQVTFVADWQRNFALERGGAQAEFTGQGVLINHFEKAVALLAMDFHRCADDGVGLFIARF